MLIQIGVKQIPDLPSISGSLRALLIQIGVKQKHFTEHITYCLRALLIQIGVKPCLSLPFHHPTFESFVNSDRCKAYSSSSTPLDKFESFVNSDRCKAIRG